MRLRAAFQAWADRAAAARLALQGAGLHAARAQRSRLAACFAAWQERLEEQRLTRHLLAQAVQASAARTMSASFQHWLAAAQESRHGPAKLCPQCVLDPTKCLQVGGLLFSWM